MNETAPPKAGWPDADRVSPVLAGEVTRAILTGVPYPRTLLTGVIQRIRAEGFIDTDKRKDWRAAMHRRASIIKACLTRGSFTNSSTESEMTVSLNEDHSDHAYQFGRLFAALEKTQEEAHDNNLSRTIRDKYFGSASATPAAIFPSLLRLHAHHLKKLSHPGRRINMEKLVGAIMDNIDDGMPRHLSLERQGLFYLGYYHQRTALFTPSKTPTMKQETKGAAE